MIKVGVLGCTGMVGQRFIQLLASHPEFTIVAIGASSRSAGKVLTAQWRLDTPIPAPISAMVIAECDPPCFSECEIVFSGLDSSVAGEIESVFRLAGHAIFSNAKNHRMDSDVPLVVPFVNASHLSAMKAQRRKYGGCIVTNANCATTGLVTALKPIHDMYCIKQMNVCTLQAISGAGYPGTPAFDILGNVIPFIDDEEAKIATEPCKIFGAYTDCFTNAEMVIDASCHRVAVLDGHTETISLKLAHQPSSIEQVISVLESYAPVNVHSSPKQVIYVTRDQARPQPRLDVMAGGGYSVTVGRLRKGVYWDLVFTLVSHNTILGAAGSSILNAEIALKMGLLSKELE